ncbi:hypothetical protein EYF80_015768 [Liparis tanakae]|uniref:Uncharacterized protein n=1 Tax=Liparis tanakae TaxID=230148 RepID=A0A4Z2I7L9_9TELE|nr:hypothetical protein EYF80_015768 [Liparis tanakae]
MSPVNAENRASGLLVGAQAKCCSLPERETGSLRVPSALLSSVGAPGPRPPTRICGERNFIYMLSLHFGLQGQLGVFPLELGVSLFHRFTVLPLALDASQKHRLLFETSRQLHSAHRLRLTQQELLAVLQSPHDFLCTTQRSTGTRVSATRPVPFEIMKSSQCLRAQFPVQLLTVLLSACSAVGLAVSR